MRGSKTHIFLFLSIILLKCCHQVLSQTEQDSKVRLAQEYFQVGLNTDSVQIPLSLDKASASPVSASLAVFSLDGVKLSALPPVSWESGSAINREVSLTGLSTLVSSTRRSIIVRITTATNATVDMNGLSALVSLDANVPRFKFKPNAVAYAGTNTTTKIDILLDSGSLSNTSATLRYRFIELNGPQKGSFLSQAAGFLSISQNPALQPGARAASLSVPIDWSVVPKDAQYRVGLDLQGFYASWSLEQAGDVALFVFGVPLGVCPPGSSLKNNVSTPSEIHPLQSALMGRSDSTGVTTVLSLNNSFLLSLVLPSGGAAPLSTHALASLTQVGAMVDRNVSTATLCTADNIDIQVTDANSTVLPSSPSTTCPPQQRSWQLDLLPGPNLYNITTNSNNNIDAIELSVVRLADPNHAKLLSLEAHGVDGSMVIVCGPPSLDLGNTDVGYSSMELNTNTPTLEHASPPYDNYNKNVQMVTLDAWKPCLPDVPIKVNVPATTDTVSLTPTLLNQGVDGVRVEVNGQVLSQGGDIWANQLSDTSQNGRATVAQHNNISSLPSAFIMGMQPDVPVQVEVVVVAEDGVTSAHYSVTVTREFDANSSVAYGQNMTQNDWPQSPGEMGNCQLCPAGWTSLAVNSQTCDMCPPGTAAATQGSGSCTPCSPGTFSLPWGSTHCKHCIAGTHAPTERSTACLMCPDGTTTTKDGQAHCNVTLAPAIDLQNRYAVVIYFSVNVTGTDPEDIVLKSGVQATPETIVSNLIRTDTAAAFNISMQDVHVISLSRVARRILQANISATLGVDLPGNATQEDIAAALEVQKLSADKPIELLSQDPDAFFGRTTKTLEVGVEADGSVEKIENWPHSGPPFSRWALVAPGIVGMACGVVLLSAAAWKRRRKQGTAWIEKSSSWLAPRPTLSRRSRRCFYFYSPPPPATSTSPATVVV